VLSINVLCKAKGQVHALLLVLVVAKIPVCVRVCLCVRLLRVSVFICVVCLRMQARVYCKREFIESAVWCEYVSE
jgi:hypothetical protein